jgi:hypothetical protein
MSSDLRISNISLDWMFSKINLIEKLKI